MWRAQIQRKPARCSKLVRWSQVTLTEPATHAVLRNRWRDDAHDHHD
jgi:hypothetical protein